MRSLDGGDWQLRACLGDEWRWHVAPGKALDAAGLAAGARARSVLDDLVRAGEVPRVPTTNALRACRSGSHSVPGFTRRRFVAAQGDERIRCDGVDHSCTDVSAFIDGNEHLLAVVVDPAPGSGGRIETDEYDARDRPRILVWQEFSRRNHPSLALWCGGEELAHARA